jgi:colicin import membrane protein
VNPRAFNPGAFLFAVLLHVAIAASFVLALEFNAPRRVATPLVIKATLTSIPDVVSAPAEPVTREPDLEPVVEEPPPPDPSVEERRRLEAEKLEREQQIERERLNDIRKREEEAARQKELEEQRRREEAERKRREEEAERKRREEEALEEKRRQAELERQEQIRRQREENERQKRLEEEQALAAAIAAEEARTAARNSDEMAAYLFALQQKVKRNWSPPPSRPDGLNCEVLVRQTQGGEVLDARVVRCNGDAAVERSIEAAVRRASPLPVPQNSLLFEPQITFVFKPDG